MFPPLLSLRPQPTPTLINPCLTSVEVRIGHNDRYDRFRPVADLEAQEARGLHAVGELVGQRDELLEGVDLLALAEWRPVSGNG
jgi:hypothetical protein